MLLLLLLGSELLPSHFGLTEQKGIGSVWTLSVALIGLVLHWLSLVGGQILDNLAKKSIFNLKQLSHRKNTAKVNRVEKKKTKAFKSLTCATLVGRMVGGMSELLVMLRRVRAAGLQPGRPSGSDTPPKKKGGKKKNSQENSQENFGSHDIDWTVATRGRGYRGHARLKRLTLRCIWTDDGSGGAALR